jgi:hypothetical protein
MANKVTLKGFNKATDVSWYEDGGAVTKDEKRLLVKFIIEHTSKAKFEETYTVKRKISVKHLEELAFDLEHLGVDDAVAATSDGSLSVRLASLQRLLSEDLETDDEADDAVQPLSWRETKLTAPASKHSVLLLSANGDEDVAEHKEAFEVLRAEVVGCRLLKTAEVKATIKDWLAKHKKNASLTKLWKIANDSKDAPSTAVRAAWKRVLMAASFRAKAAADARATQPGDADQADEQATPAKSVSFLLPAVEKPTPTTAAKKKTSTPVAATAAMAIAASNANEELIDDILTTVKSLDFKKARKRAERRAELDLIKSTFKERGFVKHHYRKEGGKHLKPKLLGRYQTARARELTLLLEAETNPALLEQDLWKSMMLEAKLAMKWCDLEAEKGTALLDAIAKKRRDEETADGLGEDAEESKIIKAYIKEFAAEEKKLEAATKQQGSLVSAFTAAMKHRGLHVKAKSGTRPPNPKAKRSFQPPTGRHKGAKRQKMPKPGEPGFTGCNGILVDTGVRCGGDHYAGDHFRSPEKYGGKKVTKKGK